MIEQRKLVDVEKLVKEQIEGQVKMDVYGDEYVYLDDLYSILRTNLIDTAKDFGDIAGNPDGLECGEWCGKCEGKSQKYIRVSCDNPEPTEEYLDRWGLSLWMIDQVICMVGSSKKVFMGN